jgi:uncharacterized protein
MRSLRRPDRGEDMSEVITEDPRLSNLVNILKSMESAVIAFSGGVDSTFLLKAAALSGIKLLAVTGVSPATPEQDLLDAKEFAGSMGVAHVIIETSELESDGFRRNSPDRCFHCKSELFGRLRRIAESEGYSHLLDGSNLDDVDDWRPGRGAALEKGVRSPLIEAGLRKQDIRGLSRELKLATWNKPSSPCLSSRFPYGETITVEALRRVAAAERFLRSLGFAELRVRHHGDTARIELREDEIARMLDPDIRNAATERLRSIGYKFVSLDLEGFRSGKMNR